MYGNRSFVSIFKFNYQMQLIWPRKKEAHRSFAATRSRLGFKKTKKFESQTKRKTLFETLRRSAEHSNGPVLMFGRSGKSDFLFKVLFRMRTLLTFQWSSCSQFACLPDSVLEFRCAVSGGLNGLAITTPDHSVLLENGDFN